MIRYYLSYNSLRSDFGVKTSIFHHYIIMQGCYGHHYIKLLNM